MHHHHYRVPFALLHVSTLHQHDGVTMLTEFADVRIPPLTGPYKHRLCLCSVTIISRTSLIVSDIIVVAATWFYTYRSAVFDYRGLNQVPSFAKSFLINGEHYYSFVGRQI